MPLTVGLTRRYQGRPDDQVTVPKFRTSDNAAVGAGRKVRLTAAPLVGFLKGFIISVSRCGSQHVATLIALFMAYR